MATINALDYQPITSAIGTVIDGIDLRTTLSRFDREAIGSQLFERGVVFFRNQPLSSEEMLDFVANFAMPQPSKFAEENIKKTGMQGDFAPNKRSTAVWHADGTFAAEPAIFTAIQAVKLPDLGGDTCWSSMYAAYEALSVPMREMLDKLTAIHSIAPVIARLGEMGRRYGKKARETYGAEHAHPMVLVHPETGRKALYVNASWTTRIVELSEAESSHVLALLFEHIKQPEFCMRWRWSPGDLALWDNRCVQHYAVPDYEGSRIMQRVDTEGQKPNGPIS